MHNARGLRHYIHSGGVIAHPTESVFGLGCDPFNRQAVQRILRIKGRPQRKGLILISDSLHRLESLIAPLTDAQRQQMLTSWQGKRPYTWLVPKSTSCPKWLTGQHASIAIRVTKHPLSKQLCKLAGLPLVSTSANRSGATPVKTTKECKRRFSQQLRIVPGQTGGAKRPSTIQDLVTGRILRK